MNFYLLDSDQEYKIIILYALRKLNNDVKEKIFDLLIMEEITEYTETMQLVYQQWYELNTVEDIDLYDLYSD